MIFKLIKNFRGISLVEVLVASGVAIVALLAFTTMLINQQKETEALSQKLATLDLERFILSASASGDICTKDFTANSASFTFPTANFPPQGSIAVNNLYLSATSIQVIATAGLPVKGSGAFQIKDILLSDITGTPGNYMAIMKISFQGGIRPIKPLDFSLKLSVSVAGQNTVIVGCPGIGTAGTIPLTNFQIFNLPGNYTFMVPPGVAAILVEAWGGGGGGGGSSFGANAAGGGGGGGGGGYGKAIISVTPGQVFPLVVGAGGHGGIGSGVVCCVNGGNGSDGGNSTFGAGPLLQATGGIGGKGPIFVAIHSAGQGGAGGSANGVGSVFVAKGGNGGTAPWTYLSNLSCSGASGGSAGGGGGGGGGQLAPGSAPGGGGGGGTKYDDLIKAYSGGAGAVGQVNVWW
ncbi:MAG: hypothetical protein J0M15_05025 [Deltaproteobacteria bacterium]|nr:hypothetical protein [Deltaproteobacteria bacterium]